MSGYLWERRWGEGFGHGRGGTVGARCNEPAKRAGVNMTKRSFPANLVISVLRVNVMFSALCILKYLIESVASTIQNAHRRRTTAVKQEGQMRNGLERSAVTAWLVVQGGKPAAKGSAGKLMPHPRVREGSVLVIGL